MNRIRPAIPLGIVLLLPLLGWTRPIPTDLPPPESEAASLYVFDPDTGAVFLERDADARRAPASTQKLLTALLVVERGGLDEPLTVTAEDTRVVPSKLWIQAGQTYTRGQLLEALLIKSANDAAMALARDHSGSIPAFAEAMNRRAWALGCRNSRFINPHGLTASQQYSSARDLAKIAMAAHRDETIRRLVARRSLDFTFDGGQTKSFKNTNKVLLRTDFCTGMKTGFTRAAGHCLIASGHHGGNRLITIVLGADSNSVWADSHDLLAWGLGIRVTTRTGPGDDMARRADHD